VYPTGEFLGIKQLCPSCGDLTDELSEKTGWCSNCTKEQSIFKCERCNTEFKSETHRPYCTYCRELNWLEAHADELEEFMSQGCTFKVARAKVRVNHQPICLGCGSSMPKAGYFCKTKASCRKLYSQFHKKRQKGMAVQTALEQVLGDR
jgi:predicted amidophosphoribosyltransferase